MGRKKKTEVRLLTHADGEAYLALVRLYGSPENQRTRTRIRKEYLSFAALNSLSLHEAIKSWIGVQRSAGCKWSTLDTYAHYIRSYIRSYITPLQLVSFDEVAKLIHLAHADEDAITATPASGEDLKILYALPSCLERTVLLNIRFTGLRFADTHRLRRKQFCMTKKQVKVEVRVTKNRRERRYRRILRIPAEEVFAEEVPMELVALADGDPEDRPFSQTSLPKVNAYLKKHLPHLRTYSFRKKFIGDIAIWSNFQWERVIQYSLHCDTNVVAAHYDQMMIG